MVTYLFYFVPFCAFASYSLFNAPAKQWFLDWLIIYAGATLNVRCFLKTFFFTTFSIQVAQIYRIDLIVKWYSVKQWKCQGNIYRVREFLFLLILFEYFSLKHLTFFFRAKFLTYLVPFITWLQASTVFLKPRKLSGHSGLRTSSSSLFHKFCSSIITVPIQRERRRATAATAAHPPENQKSNQGLPVDTTSETEMCPKS